MTTAVLHRRRLIRLRNQAAAAAIVGTTCLAAVAVAAGLIWLAAKLPEAPMVRELWEVVR